MAGTERGGVGSGVRGFVIALAWVGAIALGVLALARMGIPKFGNVARNARAEAEAVALAQDARECPVRIRGYQQTFVLRGSEKRLLVQADSACGDAPGRPLRLENVRVSVEAEGKSFGRVEAREGLYSPLSNRLLVDRNTLTGSALGEGCLGAGAELSVDFNRKRLQSADGWNLSMDASWVSLPCLLPTRPSRSG